MKLDTMDGRVGSQDNLFPGKHHKHYDVISANSSGGLLLGSSSRTSRRWVGSLWYYENVGDLCDPFKCASAVSIESGVNDIRWVDEKIFVAGLDTGAVASWRVNTDETPFTPLWEAREHDNIVRSLSVNKQRNHVVSASYDGVVKIWELEEDVGNCLRTYKGHSDIIFSVDHHQTEPLFVTCSRDGIVIVWDCRLPKPAKRYTEFAACGPVSVRWLPNSENIVIGDSKGHVHVGDLKNAESFVKFEAHSELITDMELSPCGSMLATGSQDCSVRVFKMNDASFQAVRPPAEHRDYVRSLTWRSAHEVVTCAYDGQILKHEIGVSKMECNGDKDDSPEKDQ